MHVSHRNLCITAPMRHKQLHGINVHTNDILRHTHMHMHMHMHMALF